LIPGLVTFDCAQTLVDVDWSVDRFARSCSETVGLKLPDAAYPRLSQMYGERLQEFVRANMTRTAAVVESFWRSLTADWLDEFRAGHEWIDPLRAASDRLAFGADSIVFKPYADVLACMDALDARGIKFAVVSNWDQSLHRVLDMFGFRARCATVVASLEEGVEKPDPRLFQIALERVGFRPEHTVHVGDDLTDDVQGAINAGIRPVRLDRNATSSDGKTIHTLAKLMEALAWTD
jgi:putative hydrolase of the HAD superfamily